MRLLSCGHAICEACAFHVGTRYVRGDYRLIYFKKCGLHSSDKCLQPEESLQVKPILAGVRILSLDGGGVRGIIELQILKALQQRLGEIPVQRFFDLIGGTSTGALIAVGLGMLDWTVDDCMTKFQQFSGTAFSPRMKSRVRMWYAAAWYGSLYETRPLIGVLKSEFGEKNMVSPNVWFQN